MSATSIGTYGGTGTPAAGNVVPTTYHNQAFMEIDRHCEAYLLGRWRQNGPTRLNFQFLESDEFSDSTQGNWNNQTVMGRSEDYLIYTGTNNRRISFTLRFQAVGMGTTDGIYEEVRKKANWCRALAYPYYNNQDRLIAPPTVMLRFGNLFGNSMVRGIIQSAPVTWQGPFDIDTLEAYAAVVSVEFTVASLEPPTHAGVLEGTY